MQLAYTIYSWSVKGIFNTIRHCRAIVKKISAQQHSQTKLDRFIRLQSTWQSKLASSKCALPSQKTIWFHASSLGEYQIARPIIARLKQEGTYHIVFTFFSATAIDALKGREGTPSTPDVILPLPLDTRKNADSFIEKVRPGIAIFMVSEFWPNFLESLRRHNIPTLLYSGLFRPKYHGFIRSKFRDSMVKKFNQITVHDETSLKYLQSTGHSNADLVPDPLFDNAISKREEPYDKTTLNAFCRNAARVLVAGSLHLDKDLDLIASIAEKYPDTKIIIVPHEISPKGLHRIIGAMPRKTVLYSESKQIKNWDNIQCLVIDFIGALAKIYRYGNAAYVGGGFTPLLHSVIEPLVYGIPVAFGPKTGRKYITSVMQTRGIGTIVDDSSSICAWWDRIISGNVDMEKIKRESEDLSSHNQGGADHALNIITKMIEK